MKKTLLLIMLCMSATLMAQNGVTVERLAVSGGTVTFDVSWKNTGMQPVWSDTVWVFVDYNKNGVMTRLPLSAGATLTATSAPGTGSVEYAPNNNDQGVWVVGNAKKASSGSFSATVQLLTTTTGVAGACAYASNYPPVGKYISPNVVEFTGTAPYTVMLKGNPVPQTAGSNYEVLGTIESFTDKTGAPGRLNCIPMTGSIDFSASETVAKGQPVTFTVITSPTVPPAEAITYTWSATGFNSNALSGPSYTPTAPVATGAYTVTLTARSEGYCDLTKLKKVEVIDCFTSTAYDLVASATGYCADGARVTFALSGTEPDRIYQLDKGGTIVATLTGDGSPATFSDNANMTGGLYTAKVLSANGHCEAAMNGVHTISANSLPGKPSIAKPNDVCLNGGNIVFTASYYGSLEWVSNGGGVVNNNTVTFAGTATGTKTVIARSAQTYINNAPTCYSGTVTQSATVNALPTVVSAAGASRCGNGTVMLTATPSADAVIDWYTVAVSGTSVTTGNNYTTPEIYTSTTYYAQARIAGTGCISASRTAVLATVNDALTAPTGLSSNVTTICNGTSTSATLTASGANPGSGAVYEWGTGAVGENPLTTTTGHTYSVSPSAATTYWVRLKGTTGACSTTITGGATVSIAANTPPSAPTSLSSNISTICNGTSTTITLTANGGSTGTGSSAVYEWGTGSTIGNSALTPSTTTESSRTVTLSAATTYWVRLKGTGACSATTTGGTTTAIAANTPPTAPTGLSSNPATICNGVTTAATLTASGATVGSGAVYEWGSGAVGNGSPATTTGHTYSVSPSAATTYWVRLKGTGACSATTTGGVTTSIAVYSAISPGAITTASTTTNVSTNPNKTIENTTAASSGSGSFTYLWRRTGTSSATLTGTNTTYALSSDASGNYGTAGTYYFNRYAKDATCSNAAYLAATGTYTLYVNAVVTTPPGASSTQTWVVGNQTWSAPLTKVQPGCTETTNLGTTNPPTTAMYRSSGLYSGSGYLYNWKCVSENSNSANTNSLCPSPWRVPTQTDFINLDKGFSGGTGANRDPGTSYVSTNYVTSWGGVYGGVALSTWVDQQGTDAPHWSATERSNTTAYVLSFNTSGRIYPQYNFYKRAGYQVRCVK